MAYSKFIHIQWAREKRRNYYWAECAYNQCFRVDATVCACVYWSARISFLHTHTDHNVVYCTTQTSLLAQFRRSLGLRASCMCTLMFSFRFFSFLSLAFHLYFFIFVLHSDRFMFYFFLFHRSLVAFILGRFAFFSVCRYMQSDGLAWYACRCICIVCDFELWYL